VRRINGVKSVSNVVAIEPRAEPAEILMKYAEVDANRITIETNGDEVILSGIVRSWLERHEAELAGWSEPAVTKVEDRFVVAAPLASAFFAEPAEANLARDLDGGQRSIG
jgi:BON domain-containing protein